DDAFEPESPSLKPWAASIVRRLDTYCEVSPSGTGVKLFVRGRKPGDKSRRKYQDGEVELYDSRRYFAMTGQLVDGAPRDVMDLQAELDALYRELFPLAPPPKQESTNGSLHVSDEEIIRRACQARNGDRFKRLWAGDTSDYGGDHSRADQALCNHLA